MATPVHAQLRAFKDDPTDGELFRRLVPALRARGRFRDLARVYPLRAAAVTPSEAVRLWLAVADVWAQELEDGAMRAAALESAVSSATDDPDLLDTLERHFRAVDDLESLRFVLTGRAANEASDGAVRADAAMDLGAVSEQLGDLESAVDAYAAAGSMSGSHGPEALAHLNRIAAADPSLNDALAPIVEQLMRAHGDDRDLLRMLDDKLDGMGDDARTSDLVPLCAELSDLSWSLVGDAEISVGYLKTAYRRAPSEAQAIRDAAESLSRRLPQANRELVRMQRRLAEQMEDWSGAIQLCEAEVALSASGEEQGELQLAAAEMQATRLDDPQGAIVNYNAATRSNAGLSPTVAARMRELADASSGATRDELLHAVHELLYRTEDWAGVHDLLQLRVDAAGPDDEKAQRLADVAALEGKEMGDSSRAVETYARAAAMTDNPDTLDVMILGLREVAKAAAARVAAQDALLTIYERRLDWDDWIETQEKRLVRLDDPQAKKAAHHRLAQVLRDERRDVENAARQFHAAIELDREDRELLRETKQHHIASADPRARLFVVELELDLATDDDRDDLELERIAILRDDLNAPESAVLAAYGAGIDTDRPSLWSAFLALVSSAPEPAELVKAAAQVVDQNGDQETATDIFWQAATRLGLDTADGADMGLRALERLNLSDERSDELQTALVAREQYDERIRFRRVHAARPGLDATTRMERIQVLADLLAESGDTDSASDLYRQVLSSNSDDPAIYAKLIGIFEGAADHSSLAQTLEEALENLELDIDTQCQYLDRLRQLYGGELGRDDWSLAAAERLLRLDATHIPSLDTVHAYAELHDDYTTLYRVLNESAAGIEDEAVREARSLELAELAQDRLNDAAIAVPHWQVVLTSEHVLLGARQRASSALLEHALSCDDPSDVPAAFDAAAAVLEPMDVSDAGLDAATRLEAAGHHGVAVTVCDTTLGASEEVPLALHEIRVRCAKAVEAFDKAAESLHAIFVGEGEFNFARRVELIGLMMRSEFRVDEAWQLADDATLEHCNDVDLGIVLDAYGDEDRLVPLAARLVADAEGADEPDQIVALHKAADFVARFDGREELSESYWRAILALDANNDDALQSLEDSLREREATALLVSLFEERLTLTDEPAEQGALYRNLADLAETPDIRETHLLAITEAVPDDYAARVDLLSLYKEGGDDAKVADALHALAKVEADEEARTQLYYELAHHCESVLEDSERAAAVYEELIERAPLEERALVAMERVYRKLKQPLGLARATARRAGLETDEDRKVKMWRDVAKLRENELEDLAGAAQALEEVLKLEPKNLAILEDVASLYERTESWAELLTALERMGAATQMREVQAEVLIRAGSLMHDHLERSGDGFELLVRSFEVRTPTDEVFETARQAATSAERWSQWANVLLTRSRSLSDEDAREVLDVEMGTIVAEKLGEVEPAINVLLESHNRAPRLGARFDLLEELAKTNGMQDRIVDAYKRLQRVHGDDPVAAWRGLKGSAEIAEGTAGRPDFAFDLLQSAWWKQELRADAEQELLRLAEQHGLWAQWASHLGDAARREGGDYRLRQVLVLEERLEDPDAAFAALIKSVEADPRNVDVREALYALSDRNELWGRVFEEYERALNELPREDRSFLLEEMATLCADPFDDAVAGFNYLTRAWQQTPDNDGLRARLDAHAREHGKTAELLDVYETYAASPAARSHRRDALLRAARLASELKDYSRTVHIFEGVFGADPNDESMIDEFEKLVPNVTDRLALVPVIDELIIDVRRRPERARWFQYQATLAEAAGDFDKAASSYQSALKQGMDPELARPALIRVLGEVGQWDRVAKFLQDQISSADTDRERVEGIFRLSDLYMEQLEDPKRSLDVLTKGVRTCPDSRALHDRIVTYMHQFEHWDDLIDYLVGRGNREQDVERSKSYFLQAARSAEEFLSDPRRTVRLTDLIIRKHGPDRAALEVKAHALAELGRWMDHIKALEQVAELSTPEGAAAAFGMAAAVFENQLFYADKALRMWGRALVSDPKCAKAAIESARLQWDAGRHSAALGTLRGCAVALEPDWERMRELSDLLVQLADYEVQEGVADADVLASLRHAVDVAPMNQRAVQAYRAFRLRTGGIQLQLEEIESDMAQAADDDEMAFHFARKAAVLYFEGGDLSGARAALESADDVVHTTAAELLRADIAYAEQDWQVAHTLYADLKDVALDDGPIVETQNFIVGEDACPSMRARVLTRTGYALERCLQPRDALHWYREAIAEGADYIPAQLGVARMTALLGDVSAARELAQSIVAQEDVVGALHVQAASLAARLSEQLGDVAQALAYYDAALADGLPEDEAIGRTIELALLDDNAADAVPRLQQLLEASKDDTQRARLLCRLSELYVQQVGGPERSARAIVDAVQLMPEDNIVRRCIDNLKRYADTGEGLALIERVVAAQPDSDKVAGLLLVQGGLLADLDGQLAASATSLAAAIEALPGSAMCLELLVDVFRRLEDSRGLAALLDMQVQRLGIDEVAARIALRHAHADVLTNDLDMHEEAIAVLEAIAEESSADVVAFEKLHELYTAEATADPEKAASAEARIAEIRSGVTETSVAETNEPDDAPAGATAMSVDNDMVVGEAEIVSETTAAGDTLAPSVIDGSDEQSVDFAEDDSEDVSIEAVGEHVEEHAVVEEASEEQLVGEAEIVEEQVVDEYVVSEEVIEEQVDEGYVVSEEVIEEQVDEGYVVSEEIIEEEEIVDEYVVSEEIIEEEIVDEYVVSEEIIEEKIVDEYVVSEEIIEEEIVDEYVVSEEIIEEEIVDEYVVSEEIIEEEVIEDVQVASSPDASAGYSSEYVIESTSVTSKPNAEDDGTSAGHVQAASDMEPSPTQVVTIPLSDESEWGAEDEDDDPDA